MNCVLGLSCLLEAESETPAPRQKYAMEMTVIVTWTGSFTAKGYVPGRLSASLHRELPEIPSWLAPAPKRMQLGFAPVSSASLCSLTAMGRFVIRCVAKRATAAMGHLWVQCACPFVCVCACVCSHEPMHGPIPAGKYVVSVTGMTPGSYSVEVVATVALCARDAAEDAAIDVRSSQLKLQVRVWLAPVAESSMLFGRAHLRLPTVARQWRWTLMAVQARCEWALLTCVYRA